MHKQPTVQLDVNLTDGDWIGCAPATNHLDAYVKSAGGVLRAFARITVDSQMVYVQWMVWKR